MDAELKNTAAAAADWPAPQFILFVQSAIACHSVRLYAERDWPAAPAGGMIGAQIC